MPVPPASPLPFPLDNDDLDGRDIAALDVLADNIAATLKLASALLSSRRAVDLDGLETGIGVLCAKTLDLPPELARTMRPRLIALRTELDHLAATLQTAPPTLP